MPVGPAEALLAFVVVAFASAVQASVGFEAGLIAAPILVLVDPAFAPGPILASNLVLTTLVTWRELGSVDVRGLRVLVAGRLVGTLPAAALLAVVTAAVFDLVMALLVLAAVIASVARGGFAPSVRNLGLAGVASGLMGTISSIGGPPVALVYQNARPDVFRATLGANLVVGAVLSLIATRVAGRLGAVELRLIVLLVPAAVIGFWLSRHAVERLDTQQIRVVVLLFSTIAALALLLRAFTAILVP